MATDDTAEIVRELKQLARLIGQRFIPDPEKIKNFRPAPQTERSE